MKKLTAVLGAAVLAASFIGGAIHAGSDSPAAPEMREQDLFSFVRTLPSESSEKIDAVPQTLEPQIDPQWKHLFNRHLVPGTEQPSERVRRDIAQKLEDLPNAKKSLAMSMLDKYLRYRAEMTTLQSAMEGARDAAGLASRIDAMQQLRTNIFTADERNAFFRSDEEYESLMLARREVSEDATLTDEQKHQRLQQLEATASPESTLAEEERTGVVRLSPEPVIAPSAEGEEDVFRLAGTAR